MKFIALLAILFIACAGPEGPAGPQGPRGEPGLQGAPGNGLVGITACRQPPISFGSYTLAFYATRYDFADGSVMITCTISDWGADYNSVGMYKANQQGAVDGGCLLGYDVDASNPTGGFFNFSVTQTSTTATATYTDSGSSSNGRIQTLACTRY